MARLGTERVLLIGDSQQQVRGALAQALPGAEVREAANYFDAIAELANQPYTAVVAPAEPIERRPEAAVRTLRELAREARLILFGHPTLEPLSRKMLQFGCDDYVITPASAGDLHEIFGSPCMRIARNTEAAIDAPAADLAAEELPLAELFMSALIDSPHDATAEAVKRLNELLGPNGHLMYVPTGVQGPQSQEGKTVLSHAVQADGADVAQLHLLIPPSANEDAARRRLRRLAELMSKLHALQDRHGRLQKLAITDELTGIYNARYFRHFLSRIIERARAKLFPVTLLIFDIDDFKKYNDLYGHGVGDEILKETASLMKRCCREHDLVARLGGDEFAVVFWEKEGPRQPKESKSPGGPALKPPQTPELIFERFRRLLETKEFPGLGPEGKGMLTISAGLAVFPYHAGTTEELIDLADKRLMFGAKRAGKNSIFLVGRPEGT
jgi:PleD family two-component response regulator